jgi:hypothetical protein
MSIILTGGPSPTTMVPLMVVASRAEGPARRGSRPTTAINTMARRPAQACLYTQHNATQHDTALHGQQMSFSRARLTLAVH